MKYGVKSKNLLSLKIAQIYNYNKKVSYGQDVKFERLLEGFNRLQKVFTVQQESVAILDRRVAKLLSRRLERKYNPDGFYARLLQLKKEKR